jgi:hypothetical protein
LCFVNEIDWDKIKKSKDHETHKSPNRDAAECSKFFNQRLLELGIRILEFWKMFGDPIYQISSFPSFS